MKLHAVTCHFNPSGAQSLRANHTRFEAHMARAGVPVTTIEAAFGDEPHRVTDAGNPRHIQVRANSVLWIKENLGNLAAARLPPDVDGILWLDADVEFLRADWLSATERALQHHAVVQPWSECVRTGPESEFLGVDLSFGSQYVGGKRWPGHPAKYGELWHPGYAWAFRRDAWNAMGGLIDTAACGAGDHHMACALIGRGEESLPRGLSDAYRRSVLNWQDRAGSALKGNLGFVPGAIRHHWHGRAVDRRYQERWEILRSSGFDPDRDLCRNIYGVYELRGDKPRLRDDLRGYFRQRNDNANTVN